MISYNASSRNYLIGLDERKLHKETLSLVGLLQHATNVVKYSRAFVSRMYWTAVPVRELHF